VETSSRRKYFHRAASAIASRRGDDRARAGKIKAGGKAPGSGGRRKGYKKIMNHRVALRAIRFACRAFRIQEIR
jgi:hypothetical protein